MAAAVLISLLLAPAPAYGDALGSPFRVSFTGPDDTNFAFQANDPSLAYNPQANQYLAVWAAVTAYDSQTGNRKWQILGRFIDASGGLAGPVFPVSDESPPTNSVEARRDPEVVYNSRANEFMVAWHALSVANQTRCPHSSTAPDTTEIYVQRLSATGARLLSGDQQISTGVLCPRDPQLSYSPVSDRYLVVWEDEDGSTASSVSGQLLAGDGTPVGANVAVSGSGTFLDGEPDMAYDSVNDRFLVVWQGTNTGGIAETDQYILGQRYSGAGTALGSNFAVSGPRGAEAAAAFNSQASEFLVVWQKDKPEPSDPTQTTQDVRAQRLTQGGTAIGGEILVSPSNFDPAKQAKVAYDPFANRYMLVFEGGAPETSPGVNMEGVWGQELDATGNPIGTQGFEIASMSTATAFEQPEEARSIVFNTRQCEYLTTWEHPVAQSEGAKFEIFASRLAAPACPVAPAPPPSPPAQGPSADLAVTKLARPSLLQLGGNLTYTLTITNSGPSTATAIKLKDVLPRGPRLVRVISSPGTSCTRAATVDCDLGSLAPGGSLSVTIVVRPRAIGRLTNSATVSANEPDPNLANNSVSVTSRVRDTVRPLAAVMGVRTSSCIAQPFQVRFRFREPLRLVEVSLDGRRIRRTNHGTVVLISAHRLAPGIHFIEVVSVDRAGNRSARTVSFFRCRPVAPRFTG